jgi:mannose-1-phosphate guanylyltransferase
VLSVILAGGTGERFWPLSRRNRPKQLLDLTGKGSMISLTVDRARTISEPEEIFIVTLDEQRESIAGEIGAVVPDENIVGEPVGRNTAASIGLAALLLKSRWGDVPFLVLPADHLVEGSDQFVSAVRAAENYVKSHDCLLTFGIPPSRPETGYGYVRAGNRRSPQDAVAIHDVAAFHEKPTAERAREFLEDGSFLWNSGMFCWTTRAILDAIRTHLPELDRALADVEGAVGTRRFDEVLKEAYSRAPSLSIDYGVMEKADNVVVARGQFYWNDVGNWESVREVYPRDHYGNVLVGEHVVLDAADNTIFAPGRTIAVAGLRNIAIVDGGDAILVCDRGRVQQVREIVDLLKKKRRQELL